MLDPNQLLSFQLTTKQYRILIEGLGEIRLREGFEIYQSMETQMAAHINAASAPAAPAGSASPDAAADGKDGGEVQGAAGETESASKDAPAEAEKGEPEEISRVPLDVPGDL